MTFDEYQNWAEKTIVYPNPGHNLPYVALGLAGEAGEVAEKIKKLIRDKDGVADKEYKMEIAKELGDVLWYISTFGYELGISLDDIAKMNIEKLRSRLDRKELHGSGDNR